MNPQVPQFPERPERPERPAQPTARPIGVVLSAVALGLAAGLLLLFALGGLATVLRGMPATAAASAGVNTAVMLVMTLLYVVLAGWAIATLAGLLRLRPWARVSAMVIAGCTIGFGLLFAVGITGAQSLISSGSVPLPAGIDLRMLHKLLLIAGALFLFMAALGIVCLVYFARRGTREAFNSRHIAGPYGPEHPDRSQAVGDEGPPASPAWPARTQQLRQPLPDPLTDFTVARPLVSPPSPPPSDDPR